MSQTVDLKELEKKAFRSTFQDGLWDIYLGFLLLVMGGAPLVSSLGLDDKGWILAIDFVLVMLAFGAFWAAKKFITVPRIGQVKFGAGGKARQKRTSLVMFFSVVVGLALLLVMLAARGGRADWALSELLIPGVWAVNVLLVFGLAAYFMGLERLYFYAVLYAVPVPLWMTAHRWTDVDLGFAAFAVPAGIMIVIGALLFARFLRDYPVPEEVDHASDH
jgi:hypothetical protein